MTGAVLVEFNSGGQTAAAAKCALHLGLVVAVADNSGTYDGDGLLVRMPGNVGFGAACNAAVALLPPEVDTLVLWNPDARIEGADLRRLVRAVRQEGWVALAPSVETENIRRYGFGYPNFARELWITVRETRRHRRGRSRPKAGGRVAPSVDTSGAPVVRRRRFGTAAMLVVDRSAFEAVGGFDERYFLYVEDLDLWDRLQSCGRSGFLPSARAVHASAGGSDAPPMRRTVLRWVGVETFIEARGRHRWRAYRAMHRLAMRLLPADHDEMVEVVRRGVMEGRTPTAVQDDLRSTALDVHPERRRWSTTRLGWSRTRVTLPDADFVLDVGSGAFPNPRADVLCERSPVRRHRTAVVDRPFVVADALALPFRTAAFDFVIASHLAEHVVDPLTLCAELDRVARAGYIETPSPGFERLFPERNHRWRVRSTGRGRLRFVANAARHDVLTSLGRRAYPWYYAGQEKALPTVNSDSVTGRMTARLAYLVRGALNRTGLTVTRCRFGGLERLTAEIRE